MAQASIDKAVEVWNTGNTDMVAEVYTENCVPEGRNNTQKNLDDLKAWIEASFPTSPDIKVHTKPGFTLVPPQIEEETSEE